MKTPVVEIIKFKDNKGMLKHINENSKRMKNFDQIYELKDEEIIHKPSERASIYYTIIKKESTLNKECKNCKYFLVCLNMIDISNNVILANFDCKNIEKMLK